MINHDIRISAYGMEKQLAALWREAFGGTKRETDMFFRNAWKPENTIVILQDGIVVSALHMLPCHISDNGTPVKAHYIYAAATFKSYRGRGYMGKLLNAAYEYGKNRGDAASILLPGENSLYEYYSKFGYRTVFGIRRAEVSKGDFVKSGDAFLKGTVLTGKECAYIRNRVLTGISGSVLWNAKSVQYAIWVHKLFGGKTAFSQSGYCLFDKNGVSEIMTLQDSSDDLISCAEDYAKDERFYVNVPVSCELFKNNGDIAPKGMMRPILPQISSAFSDDLSAYLGLAME